MKKIELGLLILVCLGTSSSYARDNIFAPKKSEVSNDDLNVIVQEKLDDQKFKMENNFLNKISDFEKNIKKDQSDQISSILASIEDLKRENEELRRKNQNRTADTKTIYSEDDVSKELNYLLEDSIENDTFIMTDDLTRLNKEYGEESLVFVAIVDEHKVYKNKDGEYIVKGLDFNYSKFKEDEKAERKKNEELEDSKPPRKRTR